MRIAVVAAALALGLAVSGRADAKGGHSGAGHSGVGHAGSGSRSHASGSEHLVAGYTKKNGTHVAPHYATNPNGTKRDNYSSKGNVNPHTGKVGTKDPDK